MHAEKGASAMSASAAASSGGTCAVRGHVFDEIRCGLGLQKHSHAELARKREREDASPLFFPATKGWRNIAPPKSLPSWVRGPLQVLEALIGAPPDSLKPQDYTGSRTCEAVDAQLQLLQGNCGMPSY